MATTVPSAPGTVQPVDRLGVQVAGGLSMNSMSGLLSNRQHATRRFAARDADLASHGGSGGAVRVGSDRSGARPSVLAVEMMASNVACSPRRRSRRLHHAGRVHPVQLLGSAARPRPNFLQRLLRTF
jgi:hypothetical protein